MGMNHIVLMVNVNVYVMVVNEASKPNPLFDSLQL